jgi:LemA protein
MISAILGGLVLLVALWLILTYNRFISLRNTQREAWSGIDVQLRKRHDLVPPLVECVRGYQTHERGTFEAIAATRATGASPSTVAEKENRLTAELRGLFAVAEQYPELKADANFRQLSAQLVAIEDDLQYARRYFNGAVRDFRNAAESFPSVIVARTFGFHPDEFFEIETASERSTPTVNL